MIYLDNASTTKCLDETIDAMSVYEKEKYFNPNAKYGSAVEISTEINKSRKNLLIDLSAEDYSLVFTSSATEANNLVIASALKKNKELIVSAGEHSSIYEVAKNLQRQGRTVHFAELNPDGTVDADKLLSLVNANTGLVSIIHVNNETGAINNIKDLAIQIKSKNKNIKFHSDGVQAFQKIEVNLDDLDVDYYTISSHKICGPKGAGALVFKKNEILLPSILGGGQENGNRSGTENVPAIIGFSHSSRCMRETLFTRYDKVKQFKTDFITCLNSEIEKTNSRIEFIVNGDVTKSSPYILSVCFEGIKGEVLLHSLEKYDILVGTGSACSSKQKGNRVLASMQKTQKQIDGNIRFSFSVDNVKENPKALAKLIVNEANKILG